MKKLLLGGLLAIICLWQNACIAPFEEQLTDVNTNYRDSLFRHIADLQDQQQVDSLLNFLDHPNPTYRYQTAMAFATIRDSSTLIPLTALLEDKVDKVRAAAAFAIGQTGLPAASSFLSDAFDQADTAGVYALANKAILEAIGKCGDKEYLQLLSTIQTYEAKDSALLEGQAWGIYRYGIRKIIIPEGTARMAQLVQDPTVPTAVKLIAANYFFRVENLRLDTLGPSLIAAYRQADDPRLRMALAVGLGKTQQDTALSVLLEGLSQEQDYRVKCNILRALANFEYDQVSNAVFAALLDENPHVRLRAADYFLAKGEAKDAGNYWRRAKVSTPWRTQLTLYAASNRYLAPAEQEAKAILNRELRQRYFRAQTPYEKAAALTALAEFPWNYRFIQREGYRDSSHVVRGASVQALAGISARPNFQASFGNASNGIAKTLATHFQTAISSGDSYMIYPAAQALQSEAQNFGSLIDNTDFLTQAIDQLSLPADRSLYNLLQKTKAVLEGEDAPIPDEGTNQHPIAWSTLDGLDLTPEAILKTSKGDISIELLPNIAPGSVANFLQLVENGFYEGKSFHRAVPNFVVQIGQATPKEKSVSNYTIRSEISQLHYDQEGLVGMAHAGSNTESTHFFITHSPTPHLDGNYTIFARIKSGKDVLHNILIGDAIESISIH